MREIKFRVWDKMIPRDLQEAEDDVASGEIVEWDYVKKSSYLMDGLNGKYPIMQYTGTSDLHGNEIYEGDIVKNAFGEEYKIIWDEKRCQFIAVITIEDGSEWYQNVSRSLEVIGNIYENSTK
ncbi:YopX family protein [Bacillus toyonensis]|uniref:YopX family protein n=1 Tax=Bacillus toyonensis TaxID=155322 RepID=UPI002E1AF5EE|nr:YopX family protein [Bacillus toyonensis]